MLEEALALIVRTDSHMPKSAEDYDSRKVLPLDRRLMRDWSTPPAHTKYARTPRPGWRIQPVSPGVTHS